MKPMPKRCERLHTFGHRLPIMTHGQDLLSPVVAAVNSLIKSSAQPRFGNASSVRVGSTHTKFALSVVVEKFTACGQREGALTATEKLPPPICCGGPTPTQDQSKSSRRSFVMRRLLQEGPGAGGDC